MTFPRPVVIKPARSSLARKRLADSREAPASWAISAWVARISTSRPSSPSGLRAWTWPSSALATRPATRSEEHTSELQSLRHLVCRLLLLPPRSPLFPYTTLFRSTAGRDQASPFELGEEAAGGLARGAGELGDLGLGGADQHVAAQLAVWAARLDLAEQRARHPAGDEIGRAHV